MKNLVLLFLLSIFTFTVEATPLYFNATALSARLLPNGEWSPWEKVTIPFSIDAETKHIEIFSKDIQLFDYTGFSSSDFDGGTVYGSYASDKNGATVYIEMYCYNSGIVYFKVEYSDAEYRYKLEDY